MERDSAAKRQSHADDRPGPESDQPRGRREEDEDEFLVDESLVRLVSILAPRIKGILAGAFMAAACVGGYLYLLVPAKFECKAVIAPDVFRDMTAMDLVQMKSDQSEFSSLPFPSQLSQLKTLASSTQVKRGIIEANGLMERWECEDTRDCLRRLSGVYSVREVRNVGLELSASLEEEDLCHALVESAIQATNEQFMAYKRAEAEKSIKVIRGWIADVTQAIQATSEAYIRFASENNITDLEQQFNAGTSLLGILKQNIVLKEAEFAEMKERFGERSVEIIPINASLKEMRGKLDQLRRGTEEDQLFPPLEDIESLRLKVQDYQDRLNVLRNRAELFNKQLAAALLEAERQSSSIMVLDEPLAELSSKGTVKFSALAFVGVFFLGCVAAVIAEYIKVLRERMAEQRGPS